MMDVFKIEIAGNIDSLRSVCGHHQNSIMSKIEHNKKGKEEHQNEPNHEPSRKLRYHH
jgi:hypothetical protein